MIFLKGKNYDLRIEENDEYTEDFINLLNDVHISEGSQLFRMPLLEPKKNDGRNLILGIFTDIGGKPSLVGRISLEDINFINQSAEFKIFLKTSAQNKGIGTASSIQVIEHGFKALNLHRIHCGTLDTNKGFKSLAVKLGMRNEGTRTEAVFKDGKFINVVEFGLIRSDYLEDQSKV